MKEIIKSPRDKKEYAIIQLPNGLRALLISKEFLSDNQEEEEETGEASVAMCVNVGTFQDPPHIHGLAHLTEHMLFHGTKKFPKENGFDEFLESSDGWSNAYTESDRTVYTFLVEEDNLSHALDMFSQLFISPLFNPESLQREIEAVNSEFLSKCTFDLVRQELLFSLMAKKNHPLRKFGWGNKYSLQDIPSQMKVDIHKEIRMFYSSYYTARNMALVIQSVLSISELQEMVTTLFSLVIDGPVPCRDFDPFSNPFDPDRFNTVYWVESSDNNKSLSLSWSFYPINIYYKTKPFQFLAKIFERENKGSLIYVLRRRRLATEISSCNQSHFYVSSHSIFSILIDLTDYGFDNICETISLVLSFVEFLKLNIYKFDMFYEECQKLEYYSFNYNEHKEIEVDSLAEALFLFEPEHVITGGILFFEFNRDLLLECIKHLTHQEMNIMVFSQTLHHVKKQLIMTEEWSRVKYSKNDISMSWKNKFKKVISDTSFQIPDTNIFFPHNLDIKIEEDAEGSGFITLVNNIQSRITYVKDEDFDLPKAYIYFRLFSPIVNSDPQSTVALEMVIYIINKYLSEECSDAFYAKIYYNLYLIDTGLIINLEGFNDKIFILFTSILTKLVHFDIDDSFFDLTKHDLERFHYNDLVTSTKIAKEILKTLLLNGSSTLLDQQFVLQFVTKVEVLSILKEFLANLYVEGVIEGNVTSKEALEYYFILKNTLQCTSLSSTMVTKVRVNKLPPKSFCCRVMSWNKREYVNVVYNYYQIGTNCEYNVDVVAYLISLIREPIYNELRTQEQLGYLIDCNEIIFNGVQGFFIIVQSPSNKFSCDYIYQRIQAFIDRVTNRLKKMKLKEIVKYLPDDEGSASRKNQYKASFTRKSLNEKKRKRLNRNDQKAKRKVIERGSYGHIFYELIDKLKKEEFPIISVQIVGENDPVANDKEKFCSDINHKNFLQNMEVIFSKCTCCKLKNCFKKCETMMEKPLLKTKNVKKKKDLIFIRSIDHFKKSLETYPVCPDKSD